MRFNQNLTEYNVDHDILVFSKNKTLYQLLVFEFSIKSSRCNGVVFSHNLKQHSDNIQHITTHKVTVLFCLVQYMIFVLLYGR
jgi:hypothetical protein